MEVEMKSTVMNGMDWYARTNCTQWSTTSTVFALTCIIDFSLSTFLMLVQSREKDHRKEEEEIEDVGTEFRIEASFVDWKQWVRKYQNGYYRLERFYGNSMEKQKFSTNSVHSLTMEVFNSSGNTLVVLIIILLR